jgi:hypothetical protein
MVIVMRTIYETNIDNELTIDYLTYITNKVYSLLPMYEESFISSDKLDSFKIYQNTLIQTINGNIALIQYNNIVVLSILSHLESLKSIQTQQDYKRHIFKICTLITQLKRGLK